MNREYVGSAPLFWRKLSLKAVLRKDERERLSLGRCRQSGCRGPLAAPMSAAIGGANPQGCSVVPSAVMVPPPRPSTRAAPGWLLGQSRASVHKLAPLQPGSYTVGVTRFGLSCAVSCRAFGHNWFWINDRDRRRCLGCGRLEAGPWTHRAHQISRQKIEIAPAMRAIAKENTRGYREPEGKGPIRPAVIVVRPPVTDRPAMTARL